MAKNIIIFSDGTSNTKSTNTNVYQFYKALTNHPLNQCFYDPGVGSFNGDILGKAFGTGLSHNIKQCYDFIVSHYEPDDRLFLFGFSRGAYTVRSLASMLLIVGLVEKNSKKLGNKGPKHHKKQVLSIAQKYGRIAYDVYRSNKTPAFRIALEALKKRQEIRECPVFALGVWDTVGAIGLPNSNRDHDAYGEHYYHQPSLPRNIAHAYHALSIDDERREFFPVLFNKRPRNTKTIKEVWFSGMHSDVGGGYKQKMSDPHAKELSNTALNWMADQIEPLLPLDRSKFESGIPTGFMHDSRSGMAKKLYTRQTRSIPKNSYIHTSVARRIKGPITNPSETLEPGNNYRPVALNARGFRIDYDAPPDFGLRGRYKLVR
jgi:uncharacterized protein (DUF2235 family)